MAEVLGVVSSVIAVVGFAGQVAAKTQAIGRIWSEFKDAPENMRVLSTQLDIAHSILTGMKSSFLESTDGYNNITVAKQSIEYCERAIRDLDRLVDDMKQHIDSIRLIKRSKFRLKTVLKKHQIQLYRDRLQSALQLLTLSHQAYIGSLIQLRSTVVVARLEALRQELSSEKEPKPTPITIVKRPHHTNASRNGGSWLCLTKLPWYAPGYFGRVSYEVKSLTSHGESYNVYQVRLQAPFWLASKAWDFHACTEYNGWKAFLRPRIIRPYNSHILRILQRGCSVDLLRALAQSNRSIYDNDRKGQSLLHYTIRYRRFDIAVELVKLGVRLDETDTDGWTPFDYACYICTEPGARTPFFKYLASSGLLHDLSESQLLLGYQRHNLPKSIRLDISAIGYAELNIPSLANTIRNASYTDRPKVSWITIPWRHVRSLALLDIIRQGEIESLLEFQTIPASNYHYSINAFVEVYFRHGISAGVWANAAAITTFDEWREICRHAFFGATPDALSEPFQKSHCNSTPLLGTLACSSFAGFSSSPSAQEQYTPRMVSSIIQNWLEDLAACNIDLEVYGKNELSVWMSNDILRNREFALLQMQDANMNEACGPRLASLTCGPRPRDWIFQWDFFSPEYAKQFWTLVDSSPPPYMPGSWVYVEDD